MNSALVKYEAARRALGEAKSIDEVKDIRDKAEAMRAYARMAGDTDFLFWAIEIKLRAERRAGGMLAEMQLQGPGEYQRSYHTTVAPTLDELGITKDQSSHWQLEASVSEDEFEKWMNGHLGDEFPTSSGLLNLAKRLAAEQENGSNKTTEEKEEKGKKVKFGAPDISAKEIEAVVEVLQNRTLTNGGLVRQFEERFSEFIGGGDCVAVSSCTAAMHLSYMALGIGLGDEVICPAMTHVSTAHAISMTGAKPVFVDCHEDHGLLDPDLIPAVLTPKTKAICVVHFLGQPGYMRSLADIAREHDLKIIEDCAHALGTNHGDNHVGLIGDCGAFSFYPTKMITTCEGGMFVTKHPELAEKARSLRNFGLDRISGDVTALGWNYRMTEIQAAIGIEQLKRLPSFFVKRESNWRILRESLKNFKTFEGRDGTAPYAYQILVDDRDEMRAELLRNDVQTSIHFKTPVPHFSFYGGGSFPVAEYIAEHSITLPAHTKLEKTAMERLVSNVRKFER
ncbi:hypothetical protein LCGC14_1781610 [marine sediment metagenome]|uniref:DegT/DnrJ/EryC1/StrS family aminotransferase n=1 Tax=marine sediment metagenome TaxID=412755 RepID=A0A0F9JA59_9ZZZZ